MVKKNRAAIQLGIKHGRHKLTNNQVRSIRNTNGTCAQVGLKYSVSSSMVCAIKNHKNWAHL
jgi:diketogulonate reductase-like aldo/keto reductase